MERMDSGYRDFAEPKEKIDQLPSIYLKRLYYDCVTFNPYNLHMLRDEVGTDHMLMGSDYPHLLGSIERSVSSIEALNIHEKLVRIDQLFADIDRTLADRDRKHQEIRFAPRRLVVTGMASGAPSSCCSNTQPPT